MGLDIAAYRRVRASPETYSMDAYEDEGLLDPFGKGRSAAAGSAGRPNTLGSGGGCSTLLSRMVFSTSADCR